MSGRSLKGNTVIPEAQSTTPTAASYHSIDPILCIAGPTANNIDIDEVPPDQRKYHCDIGLSDEKLESIGTKDLNKLLKDKSISKTRETQIKARRRTLKNRGNFYISFSVYLRNIYILLYCI